MKLKHIIIIATAFILSIPSYAVTDKEMDQARAIAAKLYLRWANNGSGYLDEFSVSSMSELESKLKAKEKENLKVFKSVNVPSDYASWDKTKLVEFWGSTFFSSPALDAEGRKAKDRVRKQVAALNISAPSSTPEPEKKSDPTATPAASAAAPTTAQADAASDGEAPSAEKVIDEQEQLLADQNAIAADLEETHFAEPKGKSKTWIYVVILVVLVGVVIWLMVYAANMMKKQNAAIPKDSGSASDKATISALKAEVTQLKRQLEESRAAESRLKEQLAKASAAAQAASAAVKNEPVHTQASVVKPQHVRSNEEPKRPTEIYLGRANAKGLFVRGDRRPVPGHTIFRLDTQDGNVGTFRIAENTDAVTLGLSNALHFFAGGCNSDNFEEAESATTVVTEAPGTAIFENGCWRVLRKCRVRFE